jgi:hypothetical protein
MLKTKFKYSGFLLSLLFVSCGGKYKLEDAHQIIFSSKYIAVLYSSHENSWQYLDVYDSTMSRKVFSYSHETTEFFRIDSVSDSQIFLTSVVDDFYLRRHIPHEDYKLFKAGKFNLFRKVLHLGGSGTAGSQEIEFKYRKGNLLYLTMMPEMRDTVFNLKDISIEYNEVSLVSIPSSTILFTSLKFVDSANFKLFKNSLKVY